MSVYELELGTVDGFSPHKEGVYRNTSVTPWRLYGSLVTEAEYDFSEGDLIKFDTGDAPATLWRIEKVFLLARNHGAPYHTLWALSLSLDKIL